MTDNVTPDNQTAAQEVSVQPTMIEHLRKLLDADLQDAAVVQDQIVLRIPASSIQQVLAALRDDKYAAFNQLCLLYTSPSPRDVVPSRMPSSA